MGFFFDSSNKQHGFLDVGGSFSPIDPPGSISTQATGINDAGLIVGFFTDTSNKQHGFLATPVPEPASLTLLAISLISLAGYAGLRRKRAEVEKTTGR